MKIKRLERMRESQRAFHRRCQWVMEDGLFIPHSYERKSPDALSWWTDVGFILGDRRIIVWWQHPRLVYDEEIRNQAQNEVKAPLKETSLFNDSTPNYKQIGRSRKRITSYTMIPQQGDLDQYYGELDAMTNKLQLDGIDFDVHASWHRKRLSWATGVELVAPLEVRNKEELKAVASLARRLLRGETSLDLEFPNYCYNKNHWLTDYQLID